MKFISRIAASMILSAGFLSAAQYDLDKSHTNVGFTIKHMMITNVHGNFKAYDAEIDFDEKTKTFKKFEADIEVASINTDNEKRDAHLRNDDFFAVDKFPQITFEMTSYKADGDEGEMKGNLTIKGITKPVKFKIDDIASMGKKIGFSMEGKINRSDFGLIWNKTLDLGGVAVGEEVKLKIDVEADKTY